MNMLNKINAIFTNTNAFIVVIFIATFSIYSSIKPLEEARIEYEQAQNDLEAIRDEEANKTEEYNLLSNDETREQIVRQTHKISKEDEILFVFPEDKSNETTK